jgi:hypothetical protein
MRYSVVIPLFNKAPHVEAAVRSALEQSLPPAEVIIVDDGSTDGSLDIVRSISDDRIRLLTRTPPGPGGYAARNLGIREASGDWIAFLDADDLWHRDHLASLSDAVASCAEPVGCAFAHFDVIEKGGRRPYVISERHLVAGGPLGLAAILKAWIEQRRCPLWTGAVAIRRDVLIEAGLFPEGRARRGGDKDMWLRALAMTKAAFSPGRTAEFHQETVNRVTKSTSHSSLPIIAQTIRTLLPHADAEERKLLRALSNQEIALYARYATGARVPITYGFLRSIYLPEGMTTLGRVLVLMAIGAPLRLMDAMRRSGGTVPR